MQSMSSQHAKYIITNTNLIIFKRNRTLHSLLLYNTLSMCLCAQSPRRLAICPPSPNLPCPKHTTTQYIFRSVIRFITFYLLNLILCH